MLFNSVLAVSLPAAAAFVQKPVHLVHILADDLGHNDVSWQNPTIKMPTLGAMQAGGVHLSHFHTWKACAPSRGATMSGRYPFHFGFYKNQDANAYGLPTNFSTLPMLLHDAGYSTYMVGKWHLGMRSEELTPTRRGFETWLGYYQHGEDYYTHIFGKEARCSSGIVGVDFSNATTATNVSDWRLRGYKGVYSAFVFADEATRRIKDHASQYIAANGGGGGGGDSSAVTKPMYLYLPFQSVHAPHEVPRRFTDLYNGVIKDDKRKVYAGMISALDEAVTNITATLKAVGMYDDCFFLFSSDNGAPTGGSNYPLRGGKFTYWDGGVRIQAFVYSPRLDLIPQSMVGRTWSGLGHTVDIMPTFLAAAGVKFDPASTLTPGSAAIPFDGLNLLEAIQTNGTSPRTEVVHMIDNEYNHAICDNSTGVGGQNHCGAAIRVGDFKLLVGYPGDGPKTSVPPAKVGIPLLKKSRNDTCAVSRYFNNTALHTGMDQIRNFTGPSAAACCTECSALAECSAWTYGGASPDQLALTEVDLPKRTCFLMASDGSRQVKSRKGFTSGTKTGPSPEYMCDENTGIGCYCNPPSKGCLFHLVSDPNEQNDLAYDPAHQADFARLLARLTEVSKTGVIASETMMGTALLARDGLGLCAGLVGTGYYEPWAPHTPWLPTAGPDAP